jgi:hypothetical protein
MTTKYADFLEASRRRRAKIQRLAAKGLKPAAIAREMKISRQRVHQLLKAAS